MNSKMTPNTATLRQVLTVLLIDDAEFNAFCLDNFRDEVFRKFSDSMDRVTKTNILLTQIEATSIIDALSSHKRFSKVEALLTSADKSKNLNNHKRIWFFVAMPVIIAGLLGVFFYFRNVAVNETDKKVCDGPLFPWEKLDGVPQLNSNFLRWDQLKSKSADIRKTEASHLIKSHYSITQEMEGLFAQINGFPCPSLIVGLYLNYSLLKYQTSTLKQYIASEEPERTKRSIYEQEYISDALECVRTAELGLKWNEKILNSIPIVENKTWKPQQLDFSRKILVSEKGRMDNDLLWYKTACRAKLSLHSIENCDEVRQEIRRLQAKFPITDAPEDEDTMHAILGNKCPNP